MINEIRKQVNGRLELSTKSSKSNGLRIIKKVRKKKGNVGFESREEDQAKFENPFNATLCKVLIVESNNKTKGID